MRKNCALMWISQEKLGSTLLNGLLCLSPFTQAGPPKGNKPVFPLLNISRQVLAVAPKVAAIVNLLL